MTISSKFQLKEEDIKRVGKNALIFIAPVAIIYFASVVEAISKDGFTWNDFQPSMIAVGSILLYILNVLIDFFRKWSTVTKYQ